jgi:putative ABC transport system permease protein
MRTIRLGISKLLSSPWGTGLGLVLFAFGITIIVLLLHIEKTTRESFVRNLGGIDMVAGAKGSPLQLILSTVFHADSPTGNISLAEANRLTGHPLVERTIPIALGDNHQGFRIVGTTIAYAEAYEAQLQAGQWFSEPFEASIGHEVARSTGLQVGDVFSSIHGFLSSGHGHDDEYRVAGILRPTNTVLDRLILTPLESVWLAHGHHGTSAKAYTADHQHDEDCDHDHHAAPTDHAEKIAEIAARLEAGGDIDAAQMEFYTQYNHQLGMHEGDEREITALLVYYRSPLGAVQLPRLINEQTNMQAAVPALELNRLLRLLGYGLEVLRLFAWLIILISGINIFIHLLNTLNNSTYEIALIRSLGGTRAKVFGMLIIQGLALAGMGWLAGMLLSRLLWLFAPGLANMPLSPLLLPTLYEWALLGYALFIGFVAALLPAIRAYRTDIHYTLSKT